MRQAMHGQLHWEWSMNAINLPQAAWTQIEQIEQNCVHASFPELRPCFLPTCHAVDNAKGYAVEMSKFKPEKED